MGSNQSAKRYRINPLELVIFTLVTSGFGYSVFHLFRDADELQFVALQPMHTQPNRKVPARSIASVGGMVDGVAPVPQRLQFTVDCEENPGFQFGGQVCPPAPETGRRYNDIQKLHPGANR